MTLENDNKYTAVYENGTWTVTTALNEKVSKTNKIKNNQNSWSAGLPCNTKKCCKAKYKK